MASNGPKAATSKRKSNRASKKNPWSDSAFVTTSNRSPLIGVDLVHMLAKPEAWTCLDEAEKKEILALLPESVHPPLETSAENPDGTIPPLSEDFLRYSNVWRDATRLFQLDLQNGKFDPRWLQRAQKAREERAQGLFDARKERKFEAFWGQKQKYHTNVPAGDSATVSFKSLVVNGVFEVGDVWKYSRAWRTGSARVLVEKEVIVVGIENDTLTFKVPPGRRVMLPFSAKDQASESPKPELQTERVVESEAEIHVAPKPQMDLEVGLGRVSALEDCASETTVKATPLTAQIDGEKECSAVQEHIESSSLIDPVSFPVTEPNELKIEGTPADSKPLAEACAPAQLDISGASESQPDRDNNNTFEGSRLNHKFDVHEERNVIPMISESAVEPVMHNRVTINYAPNAVSSTGIKVLETTAVVPNPDLLAMQNAKAVDNDDDDDDSSSTLSDPPDNISELDDAEFYRYLADLVPAPTDEVTSAPSAAKAPCLSRENTQTLDSGLAGDDDEVILSNTAKTMQPHGLLQETSSTDSAPTAVSPSSAPIQPERTTSGLATIEIGISAKDVVPTHIEEAATEAQPKPTATEITREPTIRKARDETSANSAPMGGSTATKPVNQADPCSLPSNPQSSLGAKITESALSDSIMDSTSCTPSEPVVSCLDQLDNFTPDICKSPPEAPFTPTSETKNCSPGDNESVPNGDTAVIFAGVNGPTALSKKIHELDGREVPTRLANSWMVFRCVRKNQDMGTLWEVRHDWFIRSQRGEARNQQCIN